MVKPYNIAFLRCPNILNPPYLPFSPPFLLLISEPGPYIPHWTNLSFSCGYKLGPMAYFDKKIMSKHIYKNPIELLNYGFSSIKGKKNLPDMKAFIVVDHGSVGGLRSNTEYQVHDLGANRLCGSCNNPRKSAALRDCSAIGIGKIWGRR